MLEGTSSHFHKINMIVIELFHAYLFVVLQVRELVKGETIF